MTKIPMNDGKKGGFRPDTIRSKFNHVYFVVQPVDLPEEPEQNGILTSCRSDNRCFLRLTVVTKEGVQAAPPPIPPDSIFERNQQFRQLLLSKIINYEKLAYQSINFKPSVEGIRVQLLLGIHQEFVKGKKGQIQMKTNNFRSFDCLCVNYYVIYN